MTSATLAHTAAQSSIEEEGRDDYRIVTTRTDSGRWWAAVVRASDGVGLHITRDVATEDHAERLAESWVSRYGQHLGKRIA